MHYILTQECGVEANTKLANQITHFLLVLSITKLCQEIACSRLGYCTQIVYQVIFRHTNTSITYC